MSSPYLESIVKPVVAAIQRDTGRPARSSAVSARLRKPLRTVQRWLAQMEDDGLIVRDGVRLGYRVPRSAPTPPPAPNWWEGLKQLVLPLIVKTRDETPPKAGRLRAARRVIEIDVKQLELPLDWAAVAA